MSPRVGLDKAAVVAAAAELADAEGLERLTMARLAERLGVRAPSLHNHVAGLAGLHRDLALLGLRELSARVGKAAIGKSGDDALLAFAHAYRAYAHERPGVYPTTLRAPDPADIELEEIGRELVETVLAVLAGYGLQGADALHATRALRSAMHGFVSLEAAGGFGLPLDLDESYDRMLRMLINALPCSEARRRDGAAWESRSQ